MAYGQSQQNTKVYDYAANPDLIDEKFVQQVLDASVKGQDLSGLLGGDPGSSQQMGAFQTVGKRIQEVATQMYLKEAQKLKTQNPNFDPDKYYIPFQGNFGEGAAANRSATVMLPIYTAQAQMQALKDSQVAFENFQSTGQVIKPSALAGKTPAYSPEDQKKYNTAAARVGATLPFSGAGIGDEMNGGLFSDGKEAGKFYDPQSGALNKEDFDYYSQYKQGQMPNLYAGPSQKVKQPQAELAPGVEHPLARSAVDSLDIRTQRGQPTQYGTPEAYAQIKATAAQSNATNAASMNITNASNTQDANAWLEQAQQLEYESAQSLNAPSVKGGSNVGSPGSTSYFSDALSPQAAGAAPAFSASQKLNDLRTQYNVDPLEGQLADLNKQEADIQAVMRQNRIAEEGKPVALGVMAGRVSEEERQAAERLDTIQRQRSYVTDQLKTQYGIIDQFMKTAQMDYEMANQKYQQDFSNKIQTINLMRGMQQDKLTAQEKQRDDARANFTILSNSITSSALDWGKASPEQKLLASKLEMQAGLPPGTLDAFSKKSAGTWEMSSILPGSDANGNAVSTIFERNKATGEWKTTKLVTDYASGTGSNSNIKDKGTYTNNKGEQVYWEIDNNGKQTQTILGQTNAQDTASSKAQDELNNFRLDIAKALNERDSFGNPVDGARDDALRLIVARYPGISEAQAKALLGE